jgi:hypothetical protein
MVKNDTDTPQEGCGYGKQMDVLQGAFRISRR